jgi:hypothetical protein
VFDLEAARRETRCEPHAATASEQPRAKPGYPPVDVVAAAFGDRHVDDDATRVA